jgi:hypothetical protein
MRIKSILYSTLFILVMLFIAMIPEHNLVYILFIAFGVAVFIGIALIITEKVMK